MSKKQSTATKKQNAERAKERAAAIRKEQERKERRRRTLATSVVVVGVLSVIVAIAVAIQSSRDTTGQSATPPAGAVDAYAIPMGESSAPVTVEVYEDFMCPYCGQFEAAAYDRLRKYADQGDVQVLFKPIAFLDRASQGAEYSTRSMNAAAVVLDQEGPEAALTMHNLLYENQPAEGTEGLSDDELVQLAVEAGAEESAVREPIESREFEQWVKNATDQASKDGVSATPTVMIDGEPVEYESLDDFLSELDAAVQSAG
jgi:protein-disulfide isomerase